MGMLALVLLFLATLVGIDAQACTMEDVEIAIKMRLDGRSEGTMSFNITLIDTNPNCLVTSVQHGLYESISISVKYYTADDDSMIEEARYDCICVDNVWLIYRANESENSYFNGTRTDCSDCTNTTVNDHHCEPCHSSCTGLNKCHGPNPEDCCNFIDDGNCTLNCSDGREGNSTYHCVEDVCGLVCENGGTLTEDCSCQCPPGYNGSTCGDDIDECAPKPCQNGGTCTDDINNYNCTCADGFSGINCEINIDECAPNPCKNGGTCIDDINSYNCTCVAGFSGINCDADIDECEPNPCQNRGICADGINSYNCTCEAGFEGSDCEMNIDDCEPNPCQNGGTCTDAVNNYNCTCAAGFSGINCTTINNCESNPCQNGGTCNEKDDDYDCACPECFMGKNCEIPDNSCICPDITVAFTLQSYQVLEKNGPAQPVLRLSRAVDCCSTISVWVYVEEIDAKQGRTKGVHDYTVGSHVQVLFPGGTTTAKFDVRMVDDMLLEGSERFSVSIDPLSLPYGVVLGNIASAEVEILDDDETQVYFQSSKYTVDEADGFVEVTLKLTKPILFTSSLQLITSDFTTIGTCDYSSSRHNVSIPLNETTFTYNVPINDDDLFEIDETFQLEILKSSLHSQVKRKEPYRATVTIANDEEPIKVSLTRTEHEVNETDEILESILLTLNKPSPCCLNVYVEVTDHTATGGGIDHSKETVDQYNVTFPAGVNCSSFNIPITDDELSEGDEHFTFTIMKESLPYGVILGEDTTADVTINDNDIYLSFSSMRYEVYENAESLCITVTHDRPAIFDATIEILETSGTATSGTDYDSGPYYVTIKKGDTSAEFCIDIYNDTMLEMEEAFTIRMNETILHPDIVVMEPSTATITIRDDEYILCFNQTSYLVEEGIKYATLPLMLSTALQEDIIVKFGYADITATGNETTIEDDDGIDYYASYAYPNFDIIPKGNMYYTLTIKIMDDKILEDNELFRISALPPVVPAGHIPCTTDVIIQDNDDFVVEFAEESYAVNDKNVPEVPVLKLKYPLGYNPNLTFPINVTVREIKGVNDSATGGWMSMISGADYVYQNYTFSFKDGEETKDLILNAIDDNIVESDETYTLVIQLLTDIGAPVIVGEIATTTITIYNDDVCYLSIVRTNGDFLYFSKQLAESVIVNITYNDDEHNITTLSSEETKTKAFFPLPIPLKDINMITVRIPASFQSRKDNVVVSKQQDQKYQDLIEVDWYNE